MGAADSPQPALAGANWITSIEVSDLEQTHQFALALGQLVGAGDLVVLTGGLGAGKTTFTRSLAEALGVQGQISSPTFVLSRIHRSASGGPDLVHVDAYRTDALGLESLDLAATFAEAVTVVEWGRGLVEQALTGPGGSWLDLELRTHPAASDSPTDSSSSPAADEGMVTDFSETEDELLGTSRTAVLRGYGPRWPRSPV